jgi:hypothetical protein
MSLDASARAGMVSYVCLLRLEYNCVAFFLLCCVVSMESQRKHRGHIRIMPCN